MFDKLAATDPDIYIIISNGAYLSPWWLMHVDAVWMINAGDAAGGSSRTAELVYRDGRYHEIWQEQNCQYPMCAPSEVSTTYTVKLDRTFGLLPGTGPFHVSSPIDDSTRGLPATCELGDTLNMEMQPREIRVLNFSIHPKDWTKLKQLQVRSPETATIEPPIQSVPVKDHAILGTWQYEHNGVSYTRTFTTAGVCTLRQGENVIWRRPFRVAGPERAIVDGQFDHRLKSDGTLHIEGHYTARKQGDKQE